MKLPFVIVSRRTYDRVNAAYQEALEAAAKYREERDDARTGAALFRESARQDREMYVAAFEATTAANTAALHERSKLTQAIRDQARGPDGRIDPRLVAYFRGRASDLSRSGLKTDEIINELGEWQSTERQGLSVAEMVAASEGDLH